MWVVLKDSKQGIQKWQQVPTSKGIHKLLLLIQCFWIGNWSYWNVISWKWVKYPTPFRGFTGATGNGVFGYKNCVDKMVSQCSIGYDSCSLDRYFCILHANHRSLISWSGYLVIISSQWIWNKKRYQIIFQKWLLHDIYLC